ncbi:hypothetical protein [Deinococcus sonorensis]|uniref:Uncharacterized protein n=1 Tax=Deinococcus sonorensis TaxID=309891 RepID=A0ABV8YEC4_9DEIO
MLPPDLESVWQRYLLVERSGVRSEALRLLERFIDGLVLQDQQVQRAWTTHVIADIVDNGQEIPVRFPLFRRVFLPFLIDGLHHQRPGCARWLAAFESFLTQASPPGLPPELSLRAALLRKALCIDPHDYRAQAQLLNSEAEYFAYTLHELPGGVLFGLNGATPEECDALLERLSEFERLNPHAERSDQTQALIDECRFHYHAYRRYLTSSSEGMTYEQFLRTAG